MDTVTREDLRLLVEERAHPCIALFAPMEKAGKETRQNPIRFKNMLRDAEARLATAGMAATASQKLLAPAASLLDDGAFWQHQETTLAVFLSPNLLQTYRLPITFDELLVINDRFHIKPLLALFTGNDQFFILALSQHTIRLLRGTRFSVEELPLPEDMPKQLADVIEYGAAERRVQLRTNIARGQGSQPYPGATDDRVNLMRYFQEVDRGIAQLLKNETAPLVLAGVDYLLPIYRERNSYPHLIAEGVTGNPDLLKPEELHAQTWEQVEPHFKQAQQAAAEKYHTLIGTGRASSDIRDIVPAAYYGRVDMLFVAVGVQQWGSFDPAQNLVQFYPEAQPGAQDLLDFAALHTILKSGTVYAVAPAEVPANSPAAASYRY